MEKIAANLGRVREQIAQAALRSGRSPNDIELVAVSKAHPAEMVEAAAQAGQTLFGESRVQEARAKIPLLSSRLRWHFIGHLQKNKIRQALPLFELMHGIDSLALAEDLQRIADEEGVHPHVLLQVNLAGEASKHGFAPEALRRDLEAILAFGRLTIGGLMTIPPIAPEPEASRRYFVGLRELRDQLETEFGLHLRELSMGMSGDYPIAIDEGATLVRVGTAIFGERARPGEQ
jgi:hypothetical protein